MSSALPHRLLATWLLIIAGQSARAQREPTESVVQSYQAYIQALNSPQVERRIAAMNDFTRRRLKNSSPADDPSKVINNLYREIFDRVIRCAKEGGPAEFRAAFRLACSQPDGRHGEVWDVSFGDVVIPVEPSFDDHFASDVAKEHPEWGVTLFDDPNDVVAVNAVHALPELSKRKREDWADDYRPVRRSVFMQEVFLNTEYGDPLDKEVALKFLGDDSYDLRWQVFRFFANSMYGTRPLAKDLIKGFPKASPELKWSSLLFCTFSEGKPLIPEATKLRKDKDPVLRSQALMLLCSCGETITDEEARYGFTHCYRELKRFWFEEIARHPGLKDFAKEARKAFDR